MTFVQATFVHVTFVHIRIISAVTDLTVIKQGKGKVRARSRKVRKGQGQVKAR